MFLDFCPVLLVRALTTFASLIKPMVLLPHPKIEKKQFSNSYFRLGPQVPSAALGVS